MNTNTEKGLQELSKHRQMAIRKSRTALKLGVKFHKETKRGKGVL